jgi:hypothetical protein
MAGFFVLGLGVRQSSCNGDRVICAHLCPLRPLERAVELVQLCARQPLAPLDRVGVDAEREGRVLVPDLRRRVGGVVAGGLGQRRSEPDEQRLYRAPVEKRLAERQQQRPSTTSPRRTRPRRRATAPWTCTCVAAGVDSEPPGSSATRGSPDLTRRRQRRCRRADRRARAGDVEGRHRDAGKLRGRRRGTRRDQSQRS